VSGNDNRIRHAATHTATLPVPAKQCVTEHAPPPGSLSQHRNPRRLD
jgi:hypothetical protein